MHATPMVRVPDGPFQYGLSEKERERAAAAAGVHPDMLYFHSRPATLTTPEFWIDRHAVTRGQFARFMRETGYELEYSGWLVGWTDLVQRPDCEDPARASCPMVGVNSEDAAAYARWAGKRLPTETEWEKAARGTDGRAYPWGNEYRPVAPPTGDLALSSTYPVGARPELASPYGVHDMAGGVLEWVRTVFIPVARDGTTDAASHLLAGSSILHRQPYSHMATSRLSWSPQLRAYNTGFRCVSDSPPPAGAAVDAAPPASAPAALLETASIDPGQVGRSSIRLRAYDWPTFAIEVPWFPHSLWVADIPEGHWGPFGGANDWPRRPEDEWRTAWQVCEDATCLRYLKTQGDSSLEVSVVADGDEVRLLVVPRNIGRISLGTVCIKTFSPFFSSQERLSQCRIRGDSLVRACDMPLPGVLAASFGWSVGEDLPHGAVVMRSYDGSAFVALVGAEGADCWGNGWPHCTHLRGDAMDTDGPAEIRMIFAVSSLTDLLARL